MPAPNLFDTSVHLTIIGSSWRIDSFADGKHVSMDLSGISEAAKNAVSDALVKAINAEGASARTIGDIWSN
jgi:hypothetical protein